MEDGKKHMNRKYELTGETKIIDGITFHRIRALISFDQIKAGDLGGWIEAEHNLAPFSNAWVSGNARVCGNAVISCNARVYGNAVISDKARVCGDARVCGNARVENNAWVGDDAGICGNAVISGNVSVGDSAWVGDEALVSGNARVCGNARVGGNATVGRNAIVKESGDYMVFKNCWSSMRWFTYTRSNKMWNVGCFCGTGADLIKKAYADSEISGRCYEAVVRAVEAIEAAR